MYKAESVVKEAPTWLGTSYHHQECIKGVAARDVWKQTPQFGMGYTGNC